MKLEKKLQITLPEYEKIFRILHGVSSHANKDEPPSCQLYNVTGALILSEVYRINARPVMGAAFIKLDDVSGNALAFADINLDQCDSHTENPHNSDLRIFA